MPTNDGRYGRTYAAGSHLIMQAVDEQASTPTELFRIDLTAYPVTLTHVDTFWTWDDAMRALEWHNQPSRLAVMREAWEAAQS